MIRFSGAKNRWQIVGQLLAFLAWIGVTAVALALRPSSSGHGTHTQLGMPPCGSVVLFGRPCPGCGLTTSVSSTLHGNLAFAFKSNVFGPIFYGMFTVLALVGFVAWLKKKRMDIGTKAMNAALLVLLAAYIAYGAVRFLLVSNYKPY